MNSKLKSFLILTRPLNVLLCMLSIFMGAFLAGALSPLHKVLLACVSGGLIMAGGNVINDFYDVEIDRINKPFRPLPSGRIDRRAARKFSTNLFALGIFLSIFVQIWSFFVAGLTAFGLIVYSARLKRTALLGNLAIGFFSALAFIYGALAVGQIVDSWIAAGFAFFFHLGREIIKDLEDRDADARAGAQTLPIRFGERLALATMTVVFVILIAFTLLPYIFDIYGKGYLWTVVFGVDLVVVLLLAAVWNKPKPGRLRKVSAILKADMFVGLIALYLGQADLF